MNKTVAVVVAVVVIMLGVVAPIFVFFGSSANAAEYELPVVELGQTGGVVSYVRGNNTAYIGANFNGVRAFSFWGNSQKSIITVCMFSSAAEAKVTERINSNLFNSWTYSLRGSASVDNIAYYYANYSVSPDASYVINFIDEYFTSFADAISYFLNENNIEYGNASFTVPAGYVAVAKVPNDSISVDMSETMQDLSALAGSPWPNIVQYIGTLESWPDNGDSLSIESLSEIAWTKGDNRNLLGQTKQAEFSHTVPGLSLIHI